MNRRDFWKRTIGGAVSMLLPGVSVATTPLVILPTRSVTGTSSAPPTTTTMPPGVFMPWQWDGHEWRLVRSN